MSKHEVNQDLVSRQITTEANVVLRTGGLYSTILGMGCGLLLFAFTGLGWMRDVEAAAAFALFAGLYSLGLYWLARAGRLRGGLVVPAFLPFIALPTFFFLFTHALLPAGAASYITGPFSFLYFHLVIMTGFLFDARLSALSGLLSGVGYFGCYLLARSQLDRVTGVDAVLRQDLVSPGIFAFKALMMLFAGLLVGALSVHARRLILKILLEKERRDHVDRLFGQYVSGAVKARILDGGLTLAGSRQQVAVLFSDIRGFSTFSEGRDPEEIVGHLNAYFDRMVEAIEGHGGVVDKFIGDAVMAVFGGVAAVERPSDAAVRAALAMREGLASLNAQWQAAGAPTFENGVGIEFGEVLEGPIGSAARKEFTVIGDAVNTASRVESLTKSLGRPILVTESVFRELSPELAARFEPLGETQVKGKEHHVAVHGLRPE